MTIRVLIADDQPVIQHGLALFLQGERDIQVVGTASTGRGAVERTLELRPDVVLMDIRMPGGSGLWAARHILDAGLTGTRIIVMTTFDIDSYVFGALDLGAAGFLLKDTDPQELVQAIRTVVRGGCVISDSLTARLLAEFSRRGGTKSAPAHPSEPVNHGLTQREVDVVRQLAEGRSNREIADSLGLEISTVKAHVGNIMSKMHVASRVQIVIWAFVSGLAVPRTSWEGEKP